MRKNPPMLMHSELTGQVYIVTRYTIKSLAGQAGQDGKGVLIAHEKYDVTDEFNALREKLKPGRRK